MKSGLSHVEDFIPLSLVGECPHDEDNVAALNGHGDLLEEVQKWNLQKSASNDEVKIELRPVLAQF